jgi:hypothetical protein
VLDKKQWHEVRNEADFMLEHAVLDYHFCAHYPSVIAVAALCNTTSVVWAYLGNSSNNSNSPLSLLKQILVGHGWDEGQVADCRQRLHDLMVHYHLTIKLPLPLLLVSAPRAHPNQKVSPHSGPVSVVEVVDLTKMAKAKEASASTLTIDITAAKPPLTDCCYSRHSS